MLLLIAAFASLLALCQADCGYPNGTDKALNWWPGSATANVKFSNVKTLDINGNPEYPISLKQPIYIGFHVDNEQGEMTAGNLLMSITISEYGGFFGCSWSEIPTFGLLTNLDACSKGIPCPVEKGQTDITAKLDFTPFESIISLLKNDAPYQLQITLNDKKTNTYANIYAQARAVTK